MGEPLGQHFLENPLIADKIVAQLAIKKSENILEIGPGKGFLTAYLIEAGAHVVAVEIDEDMVKYLRQSKKKADFNKKKIDIYHEDFMEFDLAGVEYSKICGNLPYHLTGKIIEKIIKKSKKWNIAVFMVPLAVAERAVAQPASSNYSAFSILCRSVSYPEIALKVDRNNFSPPPKIESAVIKFTRIKEPPSESFFKIVSVAFSRKRKKIKNNFCSYFDLSTDEFKDILTEAGVKPGLRPHQLDIESYKNLTEIFIKRGVL
ncbi:MAG: 16S rRNA (adenine(1518)-N(6)/adenine(1519)-N(6))-dimethyltransferase RsmA [Elusimicrobia bacterium]|jgi:16S rRNA (adenine1518-N6/adenine1519-N6)-dimethyltransferase|nr:16S rRNA (adenine(1518)-N(6)/adenine(1519)-N(6))-dimethyltransferase RsmA [Elusimicrobiota bacterium]